jgi:hypothetical protein
MSVCVPILLGPFLYLTRLYVIKYHPELLGSPESIDVETHHLTEGASQHGVQVTTQLHTLPG